MAFRRFYLESKPGGDIAHLEGDEAHHARDVIRLKAGDEALLFDGSGVEYHARVESMQREKVTFRILGISRTDPASPVHLVTACSVVKPKAMDLLVQKCTELGVTELWPCVSARTSIKVSLGDESKAEKWRRVAIEAAKQCGRNTLPTIRPVASFRDVLKAACEAELKLLLSLEAGSRPLRDCLTGQPKTLCILIGPEGGLEPAEDKAAQDAGFHPASLGPYTLRAETASIAAAAAVLFRYV